MKNKQNPWYLAESLVKEDEASAALASTGDFGRAYKKFDSTDAPAVIPNDAMDGLAMIAKAFDQEDWEVSAKGKLVSAFTKFLADLEVGVKEQPRDQEGEEAFEKV